MESHEQDLRSEVGSEKQAQAVQDDYRNAGLKPREVALLDYAVKLTKLPTVVSHADITRLREHGFTDEEIVDAVHCIGYFNLDCVIWSRRTEFIPFSGKTE